MRHAAIIMEESSKTKMQFHPGSSIFPTTPQMDQPPPVPSSSTFGNILDRHLDTAVESDEEHDLRLVNEPVAVELTDNIAVGNRPSNFVLAFTNLSYAVWKPRGLTILPWQRTALIDPEQASTRRKTLLDSITGEVRNGEILAVLGASGSGKSTLIDALANRIERTSLEGDITLNGESLDGQVLKVISAYVMQDDLLFPMLTVEETLMFSAELRLPRSVSATKKRERVQNLINQLGLRAAAKTIIGDEGHRGVSGGERRRVSIGTDIVHDPVILFLDEPTSGLDSTSAFMVVKVLQGIARRGSIVVMSVHQPSFRILGLLDRLLFLSRGQNVYRGTPAGLPGFFAEFGRSIPAGENPAEFALDLIRELEGTANGAKALVDFNKWRQAPEGSTGSPPLSLKDAMWNSISQGRLVGSQRLTEGAALKSSSPRKFANPPWKEVLVLSKRSFTNIRRMPEILALRLATVIVSSFILGTLFWHPGESPKGVTERLGFFAIGITIVFFTCADALPVFIQERYIFMRETAYNAYRRSSYVFSNAITGVPSLILLAAAFSLLTFYGVGLAGGAGGLAFFFLVILACFWAGSGFVTFLSGTFSHVVLGYTVAAAVLCYYLLFSGFFINRNRLPGYWIWFHYLSMVKYSYEAAVENEFGGGGGIRCFSRGVQMFDGTLLGGLDVDKKVKLLGVISKTLQMNLTTQSCVVTGSDVLQQQSIGQLSKWSGLLVTVGWGFLFRLLFYVSLLLGSRNKRK